MIAEDKIYHVTYCFEEGTTRRHSEVALSKKNVEGVLERNPKKLAHVAYKIEGKLPKALKGQKVACDSIKIELKAHRHIRPKPHPKSVQLKLDI